MLDKRHKVYSNYPMAEKLKLVKWLQNYPELVDGYIEKPYDFSKDCEMIVGDYISTRTVRI